MIQTTEQTKQTSETSAEFINSIPLEGGSLVPADVTGAGCLVEYKYNK